MVKLLLLRTKNLATQYSDELFSSNPGVSTTLHAAFPLQTIFPVTNSQPFCLLG